MVVMEPLLGGGWPIRRRRFARPSRAIPARRSPAQTGRCEWVWDQPEVSVVLSGMSTMEPGGRKSRDRRSSARGQTDGADDQALIARVREQYKGAHPIPCTQCGYCMPCPTGVNIPVNFHLFNYAHTYDDVGAARFRYRFVLKEERARRRMHRLRHLRRPVPAAHSNLRLDAEGGGAAGHERSGERASRRGPDIRKGPGSCDILTILAHAIGRRPTGAEMDEVKSDVLQGTLDLMVLKTLESMDHARLWHCAPHRAGERQLPYPEPGNDLPRASAAGAARLGQERVGYFRGQSPGEVLLPEPRRAQTDRTETENWEHIAATMARFLAAPQ